MYPAAVWWHALECLQANFSTKSGGRGKRRAQLCMSRKSASKAVLLMQCGNNVKRRRCGLFRSKSPYLNDKVGHVTKPPVWSCARDSRTKCLHDSVAHTSTFSRNPLKLMCDLISLAAVSPPATLLKFIELFGHLLKVPPQHFIWSDVDL